MENLLDIRFQKKELTVDNETQVDFLFRGIRMSEDVAWKLSYILGELVGVPSVDVEIEDDEGIGLCRLEIDSVCSAVDLAGDEIEAPETTSDVVEDMFKD